MKYFVELLHIYGKRKTCKEKYFNCVSRELLLSWLSLEYSICFWRFEEDKKEDCEKKDHSLSHWFYVQLLITYQFLQVYEAERVVWGKKEKLMNLKFSAQNCSCSYLPLVAQFNCSYFKKRDIPDYKLFLYFISPYQLSVSV